MKSITINQKTKTRLLFFVLTSVLLTFNHTEAQGFRDSQPEKATIYIYRIVNFYGSGIRMTIMANGNPIVRLKNASFYKFETEPGGYMFSIFSGPPSGIKITTEAGKSYYIKCYYNPGFWSAYPIIELADPGAGKAFIEGNSLHEQPGETFPLKNYKSRIGLEVSGGIGFKNFPLFIDENGDDVNLSPGGGFGIGADYSYLINKNFDITLTTLFQSSSLSTYLKNASASFNRLSFSITPSIVIPGKRKDISRFKIGAGAGVYTIGTMMIDASEIGDTKYIFKYQNAPGFHGSVLFESHFSLRGSINLGLRYTNIRYEYKEEGSSHFPADNEFLNPDGSAIDLFITYSLHF